MVKPLISRCGVLLLILGVSFSRVSAQAPANDECSGATVVSSLPYHTTENTRTATQNLSDPSPLSCSQGLDGKTVWFTYTADSTGWVRFSTIGSSPDSFDTVIGLFTGSCGSLTEVNCNDDSVQGTIRQAVLYHYVQNGMTYYILIAEWNGGGGQGGVPTGGSLVFDVARSGPPPPIFKGPKSGSVPSGMSVSTNSFGIEPLMQGEGGEEEVAAENPVLPLLPTPADVMPPKGPIGSNYIEDKPKGKRTPFGAQTISAQPVILKSFSGNDPTGFIPPDPIMAVGPNHVVAIVNSTFKIWDKSGTLLKTIPMSSWFSNVASPVAFSDPQVIYDQYAQRWVMTGGKFPGDPPRSDYAFLISVSDDDNPIGTWYNWSLPATLGDSVTGNLPDYPQIGYDNQALYISSNEYNPGFRYARVRIIGKAQLYANTAGPVTWTDFWDFKEPDHPSATLGGIEPAVSFGTTPAEFMVNISPYQTGTFFTVWKITDPLGSPTVTGSNIPVVAYLPAPNPGQLGGGTPLIEGGGSVLRHKPVYRDSSLWAAHPIASGGSNQYSAVHYVRLNPFTHSNLEDVALGLTGYWHFYPALMTTPGHDVMITFTRSGETEYAGAFATGHRNVDPPGLSASIPIKEGLANYINAPAPPNTIGRNRWGDYTGIGLDPIDTTTVWINTEYAALNNNWGTWISQLKMAPVPGKYMYNQPSTITYPIDEVDSTGDTLSITTINYGLDSLTISSITPPDSNFTILSPPSLPVKLGTFANFDLKVVFTPKVAGNLSSSVVFNGDDTSHPVVAVNLNGPGFKVVHAAGGVMYATSGYPISGSHLYSVSTANGGLSDKGYTGYDGIVSLRVNPLTHELIGLTADANPLLLRVNSLSGDAHPLSTLPAIPFPKGITFRQDTLYLGNVTGKIYRVDIHTGAATLVVSTGLNISGLDFNPVTGELWASVCPFGGCSTNNIYKINLGTGAATLVGPTGFSLSTRDILFDGNGNLFGILGTAPASNSLMIIDTLTGAGTIVGPMGSNGIQAIAFDPSTSFTTSPISFTSSWNMFSMPLSVSNYSIKAHLFPTSNSAFSYEGQYAPHDTVVSGIGYWMDVQHPGLFSILGNLIMSDSIGVSAPWNMIGSISNPVPVASIVSNPPGIVMSSYYTYDGGGYVSSDSIYPGKSYWVRVNAAGKLFLASSAAVPKSSPAADAQSALHDMNTIMIRDGSGHAQTLYFGVEREGIRPEMFELPPQPPGNVFNAGFSSHRMAEMHPAVLKSAMEYPIQVAAQSYPLTVSWHVLPNVNVRYSLIAMDKSSSVQAIQLKGDGSKILPSGSTALRLHLEQNRVPERFALYQNYPNPFNPTTFIRYDLPVDGAVKLIVYDILGKEITTLVNEVQHAGFYEVPFSAEQFASGVYFYRLTSGSFVSVQKMMVVK